MGKCELMPEDTEAVIFDLDGTLTDSMWVWLEIDKEFFASHGIEFPKELNTDIEGMGFTETAVYFKERFALSESVEEIKRIWSDMALEKYRSETPLKPGIREFLEILKGRGIKTGIATSSSLPIVEAFLASRRLEGYFDAVTTVCDVPHGKPAPDVYLDVAKKLDAAPERCLVFEDVPMGILAGKNAGMRVCAVEDLYSAQQREKKAELADYYIADFTELLG